MSILWMGETSETGRSGPHVAATCTRAVTRRKEEEEGGGGGGGGGPLASTHFTAHHHQHQQQQQARATVEEEEEEEEEEGGRGEVGGAWVLVSSSHYKDNRRAKGDTACLVPSQGSPHRRAPSCGHENSVSPPTRLLHLPPELVE